jgi:beta-glucosidase
MFQLLLSSFTLGASVAFSQCTYSNLPDYDLNGGDLPGQPISKSLSTADECGALCCATSGCYAFSLNAGAAGSRWCYLKGTGGYQGGESSGCDSGCFQGGSCVPIPPDGYFPWFNLSIPRAERMALLMANMTSEDAIRWLNDGVGAIPRLGLPAYSWEAEALHGVSWNGAATVFPENIAWGATWDVPLVGKVGDVVSLEARAKWVIGRGSDGSSSEFAGLSYMTPNNNLFISPLWGRGQETYGEDPTLTSAITYALITALQFGSDGSASSAPGNYTRMIATTKHFLGYHIESFAGDGQYRLSHSFNYTEADIQQYYMRPFRAAIAANVTACMCAYDGANGTNPAWPKPDGPEPWGVPMCAHPDMQRLMRDPALGWQGYVISDEGAITFMGPGYHHYTDNLVDAACLAMNAGTDLALGGEYGSTLSTCLSQGNVTQSRLFEALGRVMKAQFDLGWFDSLAALRGNFSDPVPFNNVGDGNISTSASRNLSRTVALESLVLLKNAGNRILPLASETLQKVALVGPAASWNRTATGSYLGNYAGCELGPGGAISPDPRCTVITLLDALTAKSAEGPWSLAYAPGCDINSPNLTDGFAAAIAAAANADVIIAAVGLDTCQESRCSEGEANDRGVDGGQFPSAGLDLGGSQVALLQALQSAYPNTPIIAVYFNGGPISSPWTMQNAAAVLEAWYPGYEGGTAVVQALFGDYSPAGRMPITTVTDMSELPPYTDVILSTPPGRTHLYYGGVPLIPFGFGLSYANFSYTNLRIVPSFLAPSDQTVTISASLAYAQGTTIISDEVTQVYGSFQGPTTGLASVPLQQLLAFERSHGLGPSDSLTVSFTINRDAFALFDDAQGLRVPAGTWNIYLGGGPPNNSAYGGGDVLQGTLTFQ